MAIYTNLDVILAQRRMSLTELSERVGITLANLPGSNDRIFNLLARLERPFYIVFLVLAGAIWLGMAIVAPFIDQVVP